MKSDRQRTAIAEACGWHGGGANWPSFGYPKGKGYPAEPEPLPDYLNDLNAMHEAEKVLFDRGDWSACRYEEQLQHATSHWCWRATAAQRAEAFLRTIGKWEEDL